MIRMLTILMVALGFSPALSFAQSDTESAKTLAYIHSLYDPARGGFRPLTRGQPGLRATTAAIRVLKKLGGELSNPAKTSAFIRDCYDPKTGGFAEPGGKAEVFTTAVGIMAVVELNLPRRDFLAALTYLAREVKTVEEIRIAAASKTRNGLATNLWQLVRSAKSMSCCSLIRFSASPRWQ